MNAIEKRTGARMMWLSPDTFTLTGDERQLAAATDLTRRLGLLGKASMPVAALTGRPGELVTTVRMVDRTAPAATSPRPVRWQPWAIGGGITLVAVCTAGGIVVSAALSWFLGHLVQITLVLLATAALLGSPPGRKAMKVIIRMDVEA